MLPERGKAVFNKRHYDECYKINSFDGKKLKKIVEIMNSFSPKKILDVGCRPEFSKIIAKGTGSQVCGVNIIDFSSLSTDNVEFMVADAEKKLELEDNSFDMVFCGELIEHMFELGVFINEIKRILKKNGIAIITTPNLACLWNRFFIVLGYQPYQFQVVEHKHYGNPFLKWDTFRGHIKPFTLNALKDFLTDNGFEIVKAIGSEYGNEGQGKFRGAIRKFVSKFPGISENIIVVAKNVK